MRGNYVGIPINVTLIRKYKNLDYEFNNLEEFKFLFDKIYFSISSNPSSVTTDLDFQKIIEFLHSLNNLNYLFLLQFAKKFWISTYGSLLNSNSFASIIQVLRLTFLLYRLKRNNDFKIVFLANLLGDKFHLGSVFRNRLNSEDIEVPAASIITDCTPTEISNLYDLTKLNSYLWELSEIALSNSVVNIFGCKCLTLSAINRGQFSTSKAPNSETSYSFICKHSSITLAEPGFGFIVTENSHWLVRAIILKQVLEFRAIPQHIIISDNPSPHLFDFFDLSSKK